MVDGNGCAVAVRAGQRVPRCDGRGVTHLPLRNESLLRSVETRGWQPCLTAEAQVTVLIALLWTMMHFSRPAPYRAPPLHLPVGLSAHLELAPRCPRDRSHLPQTPSPWTDPLTRLSV
ncbi:hypothetical protein SKAU_G00323900 [Synaphobranchus kaupii]|uniref:Uncharacterized protein n=1 Tax=Synaphobranchus kaupii TaxID=118154 RepID=A0A9Q1EP96_SYNKA|nr:hypothetical protein SKAU_G00323900 [Synaphobranchus kaupii]